jgi:hypothetical protein
MSEKFQKFIPIILFVSVVFGLLSLLIYGASIYLQPTKIETVTTQSPTVSTPKTEDVQFYKNRNLTRKN